MTARSESGQWPPKEAESQGKWVRCLHCERAHRQREERKEHDRQFGEILACAYVDCDGSPLDQWD